MFYLPSSVATLTVPTVVEIPKLQPVINSYVIDSRPSIDPSSSVVSKSTMTTEKNEKNVEQIHYHHHHHHHHHETKQHRLALVCNEENHPKPQIVSQRVLYYEDPLPYRSRHDFYTLNGGTAIHNESMEERIERVRNEMRINYYNRSDKSTETINCEPPPKTPKSSVKLYTCQCESVECKARPRTRTRSRLRFRPQSERKTEIICSTGNVITPVYESKLSLEYGLCHHPRIECETKTEVDSSTENQIIPVYESLSSLKHDYFLKSRPRSSVASRKANLTKPCWRPSNRNHYTWRDSHIADYRPISASSKQVQTVTEPARTMESYSKCEKISYIAVPTNPSCISNTNWISGGQNIQILPTQGSIVNATCLKVNNGPNFYFNQK